MLNDTDVSKVVKWDHGIAAQTILLCAASHGMGGCIIGSVSRDGLSSDLSIPSKYTIELVIALGFPKENVIIEEISSGENIKYYRDSSANHHVPKRKLDDVLFSPGKIK
jgi:nitroreductase